MTTINGLNQKLLIFWIMVIYLVVQAKPPNPTKSIPPYYAPILSRMKAGDGAAFFELSREVRLVNLNIDEFIDFDVRALVTDLIQSGNADLMAYRGDALGELLMKEKQEEGRKLLEKSVQLGSPYGMLRMAARLWAGREGFVEDKARAEELSLKDKTRAVELSLKAHGIFVDRAKKGDVQAMVDLWVESYVGGKEGFERHIRIWGGEGGYGGRLFWLRKASELGHRSAPRHIAAVGNGEQDPSKRGAETLKWYKIASDRGDWQSMLQLGTRHYFQYIEGPKYPGGPPGARYMGRWIVTKDLARRKLGLSYFQKVIEAIGSDRPIRELEDEYHKKIPVK